MSKTTEEKQILREDMQNAYNRLKDVREELESTKKTIKEAKQEIDDDFKDQLESLETELQDCEGILQRYNTQNNVTSTALPDGGWFGDKVTESYEIDSEKDFVEALQTFKKMFPSNWKNFVTGYPKLKTVKIRGLIQDGFLLDEAMAEVGIVTTKDVTFDVKLPK